MEQEQMIEACAYCDSPFGWKHGQGTVTCVSCGQPKQVRTRPLRDTETVLLGMLWPPGPVEPPQPEPISTRMEAQMQAQTPCCRACGMNDGHVVAMDYLGVIDLEHAEITDGRFDCYRCPTCGHRALSEVAS